MSQHDGLNRRSFLRNVGMTAVAGAAGSVGPGASVLAAAAAGSLAEPVNGKYDFDTPYNRFGTDSTKYDQQIRICRFAPGAVYAYCLNLICRDS